MGCVDRNFGCTAAAREKRSWRCRKPIVHLIPRISIIHWKCFDRFNTSAHQHAHRVRQTQLHFYKQGKPARPLAWIDVKYLSLPSIDSLFFFLSPVQTHTHAQFTISCVIVLLVKMESVYAISPNAITPIQQAAWLEFLTALVSAADTLESNQLANVAYENDILKPLLNHFSRFRDLKSQALIAILTQRNS